MYSPPDKNDWDYDEGYKLAYDEGYKAAEYGFNSSDNPHKPSGHERDTTYGDELNYWWDRGYNDYQE